MFAERHAVQRSRSVNASFAGRVDETGNLPAVAAAEFAAAQNEILDAEQDIDLAPIPVEELKLDTNPIPPTVLSLVRPILRD